jgi:hypothetical protein
LRGANFDKPLVVGDVLFGSKMTLEQSLHHARLRRRPSLLERQRNELVRVARSPGAASEADVDAVATSLSLNPLAIRNEAAGTVCAVIEFLLAAPWSLSALLDSLDRSDSPPIL